MVPGLLYNPTLLDLNLHCSPSGLDVLPASPPKPNKEGEKAEQGETLDDLKSGLLCRTPQEAGRDGTCLVLLIQDAKERQADFVSWATRRLDLFLIC